MIELRGCSKRLFAGDVFRRTYPRCFGETLVALPLLVPTFHIGAFLHVQGNCALLFKGEGWPNLLHSFTNVVAPVVYVRARGIEFWPIRVMGRC